MEGHSVNHRADHGPGLITITKAGWLYIILTIFLGFSAVNTGNNLLYLIVAAFLSFMGISGFFGRRNLAQVDIRLDLPGELYAQAVFPLGVTVINSRRFLPAFLVRVHVYGHEVLFPFVDKKAEAQRYIDISFEERGRVSIGAIRICSVFPFNFFIRCRKVYQTCDAVVFAHPKECEIQGVFEKEIGCGGEGARDTSGFESDMISLRDYIKGDPIKYIHWKASAKTGKLKTKELASLTHQPVIIDFDRVDIKGTEEKISCITYVILKLFRLNMPVSLRMKGEVCGSPSGTDRNHLRGTRITMLRKLALYDRE